MSSATREVRLSGELGRQFGRIHRLAVDTPAEAVRALCVLLDGFRSFVEESTERGVGYKVLVGERQVKDPDTEFRIHSGYDTSFTIAPVIQGSKNALGTILTGAALIALGVATGGAGLTLGAAWDGGFATTVGYFASTIGMSLVLGGVSQMLAPSPSKGDPGERPENKPSHVFNGPVNTFAQGQSVPICYGRMIVGSAVISAGISVGDIS